MISAFYHCCTFIDQQCGHRVPHVATGKVLLACASLLAALMLALPASGVDPVVLAPGSREHARYSFVRDIPIERVHAKLLNALERIPPEKSIRKRYRTVLVFGSPLFPKDEDLAEFEPETKVTHGGVLTLREWLALPAAQRKFDFWIKPDEDYYWVSDYTQGKKPVEFQAEYLVHLSSMSPERTQIDVVQIRARVRLGKRFDPLGRAGPGFYWDIRLVGASPRATTELVNFLADALSSTK